MCIDRLEQGKLPNCVEVCPYRALDFGPLSDLQSKYGTNANLAGLPSSSIVNPAVVIKPLNKKRQVVPYDVPTALNLLGQRPNGVQPFYTTPDAVTSIPDGLVGRSKLNLKPSSTADLLAATRHDDA